MSQHAPVPRCPACGLHVPLCLCGEVQPAPTRTRVRLLVHHREMTKSSNTARLLPLLLSAARISVRGLQGQIPELPEIGDPGVEAVVLFPAPGAQPLTERAGGPPLALIVPDGNWRQATRTIRRAPGLAALPRVTLPLGEPSRYRLRSHPDPDRISTFEAVARALRILEPEGDAIYARLLSVFDRFVERTLFTRGQLAPDEVRGGVPAAWNRWPPDEPGQ